MVWSQEDFARELHRQLVEITSIRKRVDGNADILERLSLLEESHHYLLRKLHERAARTTSSAPAAPPQERSTRGAKPRSTRQKRDYRGEPDAVSLRISSGATHELARVPVEECLRGLRWKLEDLTRTAVEAVRLGSRRRDHRGSSTE